MTLEAFVHGFAPVFARRHLYNAGSMWFRHKTNLSVEHPVTSSLPFKRLLPTAIAGLDEILLGGVRAGNTIVLEGLSGTGRSTLALEFLYRGASVFSEAGYFITLNSSRIGILRDGAEFGWDFSALEDDRRRACLLFLIG